MKDPNLALLTAYKTALASLVIGSLAIPVYSKIAPITTVAKKYVIISSQTKVQNKTKCGYWYQCTVDVAMVTRYPNGVEDSGFAVKISETVQQIVEVTGLMISDFVIVETMQVGSSEVNLTTDNENIFQYILTFQHKLNRA